MPSVCRHTKHQAGKLLAVRAPEKFYVDGRPMVYQAPCIYIIIIIIVIFIIII